MPRSSSSMMYNKRTRDKLTLFAGALCVRARVGTRVSRVDGETGERETGFGYRRLLRVCTVCVEPWEASPYSSPSLPLHYSGSLTYIIQRFKPESAGTDRTFNKHFSPSSRSSLCHLFSSFVLSFISVGICQTSPFIIFWYLAPFICDICIF